MKYWFFDGSDVVGPFTPQELAAREGFSAAGSLVCPENFSSDGDSWKLASSFPDFQPDGVSSGFSPAPAEPLPAKTEIPSAAPAVRAAEPADSNAFDKEMDTLLKNPSLLGDAQEPAPDGPSLEIPKKPAKPGPIEDYFNNINGEDLGDILGIPDPNEISDMNLARALQDQFEKTSPPADKEIDAAESDDGETEPQEPADGKVPQAGVCAEQPVSAEQTSETESAPESEPAASVPISVSKTEEPFIVLPGEQSSSETEKTAPAEAEDKPAAGAEQDAISPAENTEESENAASEETGQEPVAPSAEQSEPSAAVSPEEKQNDLQTAAEEPSEPIKEPAASEPAGPEPLPDESASTCTLPLIREGENAPAQLPVVPEDASSMAERETPPSEKNAQTESAAASQTPAAPEPQPAQDSSRENSVPAVMGEAEELVPAAKEKEDSPAAAQETSDKEPPSAETQPAAAEEPVSDDSKEQTVRDILNGSLTLPPGPEELKEPLKTVPVEPELNQIKPRLNPTPEIKQFLNTQSEKIRRSRYKKANIMLWVLAMLLALGAVLGLQHFYADAQSAAADVPVPASVSAQPPAAVRSAPETEIPSVPARPAPPPSRPSAGDKALAAVQNYQLADNKGTIASYFDRLYQARLAQGYKGEWSSEPLHKNTYIVKYRLTKPRVEPVVYVFQADAAQGRLTGALNNIALDLVGRI